MNKAILNLKTKPEFILVDGNRFNTKLKIPFKCIIKGDSKYMNIASHSQTRFGWIDFIFYDFFKFFFVVR